MKARFDYAELQRKDISNKINKILLEKQAEIEQDIELE
jgi:DNA polymerase III gamma/tau subunit